ncbi:hypothetical protein CVU82_04480, partial [Candidatus Falkowbacteria bacterium HGW-Falkowbacteria-1]
DSYAYQTVQIGTQCWFAENLRYLPAVHSNSEFVSQGTSLLPGYGVYNYDGSDVPTAKALESYSAYGVLYNWYAVDQASICPTGWHVPSDAEFTALTSYLSANSQYWCGGVSIQTAKALSSISGWSPSAIVCQVGNDQSSNNITEFTALPVGYRDSNGSFSLLGTDSAFWSLSEYIPGSFWYRYLYAGGSEVYRDYVSPEVGFSIRCLED